MPNYNLNFFNTYIQPAAKVATALLLTATLEVMGNPINSNTTTSTTAQPTPTAEAKPGDREFAITLIALAASALGIAALIALKKSGLICQGTPETQPLIAKK